LTKTLPPTTGRQSAEDSGLGDVIAAVTTDATIGPDVTEPGESDTDTPTVGASETSADPTTPPASRAHVIVPVVAVLVLVLLTILFLHHRKQKQNDRVLASLRTEAAAAPARRSRSRGDSAEQKPAAALQQVPNPSFYDTPDVGAAAAVFGGDLKHVEEGGEGGGAHQQQAAAALPTATAAGNSNGVYYEADPTPDEQDAQYEDMSMGGGPNQPGGGIVAVYADAAAHGVVAGSVVYDTSGGEVQYVARDAMAGGAGACTVNYEVVDAGDGAGAGAAPRPGVLGNGAVLVGARAELPADGSNNNAVYDMGPESQQHDGGRIVVHAPPAYSVPVKTPKLRTGGSNVQNVQVAGKQSKATPSGSGAKKKTKKKCTRPSPAGGTCKHAALPGGGMFCAKHACPECGAGKSSAESGCAAHLNLPRKQSVQAGFDQGEADAEA
jgi:hypothetical protein